MTYNVFGWTLNLAQSINLGFVVKLVSFYIGPFLHCCCSCYCSIYISVPFEGVVRKFDAKCPMRLSRQFVVISLVSSVTRACSVSR